MKTETKDKSRRIVFRDPVHKLIWIDPEHELFLLDLINTRPVQRLRRVRQLGVSWLTYHGAEHSRFSHSMGVMHVAGRIVNTLYSRYRSDNGIIETINLNYKAVLAAAILHDIGHAPFSHAMERLFPANADHEKRSTKLILEGEVATVLYKHEIDPRIVCDILEKIVTPEKRFLCDVVSSQLDADRMDYLLRDSLFAGVEYGNYDMEWIVNHLCLCREPLGVQKSTENSVAPLRLSLDKKRGVYPAQQLIMGRYHMTMQVYFHKVTRGFEAQLLCMLRRASELAAEREIELSGMPHPLDETPSLVLDFLKKLGDVTNDEFLCLDDSVFIAAFHTWAQSTDSFLKELASAFLHRQKYLDPETKDAPIFECMDLSELNPKTIGKITSELSSLPVHAYELDEMDNWPIYKDFMRAIKKNHASKTESTGTSAILLSDGNPDNNGEPVEFASGIFEAMGKAQESVVRLYYHHTIKKEVEIILDRNRD